MYNEEVKSAATPFRHYEERNTVEQQNNLGVEPLSSATILDCFIPIALFKLCTVLLPFDF